MTNELLNQLALVVKSADTPVKELIDKKVKKIRPWKQG